MPRRPLTPGVAVAVVATAAMHTHNSAATHAVLFKRVIVAISVDVGEVVPHLSLRNLSESNSPDNSLTKLTNLTF